VRQLRGGCFDNIERAKTAGATNGRPELRYYRFGFRVVMRQPC